MQQIFDISSLSKSKRNLLETCIILLSDHQWSDISIDQIEQAIHKTRGAIFHHYKTKDELFSNTILYLFSICHMGKKENESIIQTMLNVLSYQFKIQKPELAFFNIFVQASIKESPVVKDFFSNFNLYENKPEIEAAGNAFIKTLL